MDLPTLISECAPDVSPITMGAILKVESANNPYAIGIVGSHLAIQPASKEQALQVALGLHASDTNFSVGIAQINRYNLAEYNITYEQNILDNILSLATKFNSFNRIFLFLTFNCDCKIQWTMKFYQF